MADLRGFVVLLAGLRFWWCYQLVEEPEAKESNEGEDEEFLREWRYYLVEHNITPALAPKKKKKNKGSALS